jgi:peptidase E
MTTSAGANTTVSREYAIDLSDSLSNQKCQHAVTGAHLMQYHEMNCHCIHYTKWRNLSGLSHQGNGTAL